MVPNGVTIVDNGLAQSDTSDIKCYEYEEAIDLTGMFYKGGFSF